MDPPKYRIVAQETMVYYGCTRYAMNKSTPVQLDPSLMERISSHLRSFNFAEKPEITGGNFGKYLVTRQSKREKEKSFSSSNRGILLITTASSQRKKCSHH